MFNSARTVACVVAQQAFHYPKSTKKQAVSWCTGQTALVRPSSRVCCRKHSKFQNVTIDANLLVQANACLLRRYNQYITVDLSGRDRNVAPVHIWAYGVCCVSSLFNAQGPLISGVSCSKSGSRSQTQTDEFLQHQKTDGANN